MCSADIFLALLAVLFPPLPVWVKCGICSADSFINILLCVLGYVPGLLHAWYIIAKYPEPAYEYEALPQDREGGRVTYVYVQAPQAHSPSKKNQPPQRGGMGYGTQGNGSNSRQPQPQPQPQPQQQGVVRNGEGSSDDQGVPPPYAEAVSGDHKVQSTD